MALHKKLRLTLMLIGSLILSACTHTRPSTIANPENINNFHKIDQVEPAIYRSGQPQTAKQWAHLQKLGIRTVIKLNRYSPEASEEQELALAKQHGIKVLQIYMQPENMPHNFNLWAHPDLPTLMRAVAALENPDNLPALVHCSHGKDRTGLVVAAFSMRNKNYSLQDAIKEMEYYGNSPILFGLKPMLKKIPPAASPTATDKPQP